MRCFTILLFSKRRIHVYINRQITQKKTKQHRVWIISTQLFSSAFLFSITLEPIYYYHHQNNVENKHLVQQKHQKIENHNQAQQLYQNKHQPKRECKGLVRFMHKKTKKKKKKNQRKKTTETQQKKKKQQQEQQNIKHQQLLVYQLDNQLKLLQLLCQVYLHMMVVVLFQLLYLSSVLCIVMCSMQSK